MSAHCHSDEEADPNGASHQGCAPPSFEQQVTEAGKKPGYRPCEPGGAGCGFHLVSLHAFSFYQSVLQTSNCDLKFYLNESLQAKAHRPQSLTRSMLRT